MYLSREMTIAFCYTVLTVRNISTDGVVSFLKQMDQKQRRNMKNSGVIRIRVKHQIQRTETESQMSYSVTEPIGMSGLL